MSSPESSSESSSFRWLTGASPASSSPNRSASSCSRSLLKLRDWLGEWAKGLSTVAEAMMDFGGELDVGRSLRWLQVVHDVNATIVAQYSAIKPTTASCWPPKNTVSGTNT